MRELPPRGRIPMRGDTMLHLIEHTLKDTLGILPFLFLSYLLMEWLEHKAGERTARVFECDAVQQNKESRCRADQYAFSNQYPLKFLGTLDRVGNISIHSFSPPWKI
jgi:hypothetical protein